MNETVDDKTYSAKQYQALWDDRDKMEKRLVRLVREWRGRAINAETKLSFLTPERAKGRVDE